MKTYRNGFKEGTLENFPRSIFIRVYIVRLYLILENFLFSFSQLLLLTFTFFIFSFLGFFKEINYFLHVLLLLFLFCIFIYLFFKSAKKIKYVSLQKATHWLEKQHQTKHRPISALLDSPAYLNNVNRPIWMSYKSKMLNLAKNITFKLPKNIFGIIDPLALRFPLFTMLLLSFYFVETNEGIIQNLFNTFSPQKTSKQNETGELTAWLSPPKYTKVSQIFLSNRSNNFQNFETIKIPEGTVLSLRVHGGQGDAILETEYNKTPFIKLDPENLTVESSIENDGVYIVKQGSKNLGGWKFALIPDLRPDVKYLSEPSGTKRGSLRLEYLAKDDYGLNGVMAYINLQEGSNVFNEKIEIELPILEYGTLEAGGVTFHDYTDHVWAGSKVIIHLEAKDQKNQIGKSEKLLIVFPEREFTNYIAKSIINQRKKFALNPEKNIEVANSLDTINSNSSSFNNDKIIIENLSKSIEILNSYFANNKEEYEEVINLLWSSAIRIEDGRLSIAENELRNSQDKLSESLRAGTGSEEMEAMISDLDEALTKFLEEMDSKKTDKLGQGEGENQQEEATNNNLKGDLTDMVEEIADLAGTGSPEEAEKKLNELREVTENMDRAGERRLGESGEMDQREALMQQIQELMGEQETLMEESFHQAARQGFADQNSPGAGMKDAPKQQENLRKALGDVMREIGEIESNIPQELGRAERAMRKASRELQRGRPDRAADAQAKAMDMMSRGAQSMKNMIMGDGMAIREGGQNNNNKEDTLSRDPLGRIPPGIGNTAGGFVGIPTSREIRKAKDIVSELYKRSGDIERPISEREYIDRLLDWY